MIHAVSGCAVPGFVTNQFWDSLLWRARASWGSFGALCYMVLGLMEEILFTIVPQKNLTTSKDRFGLSRSAMFLFVLIIIHAVGNLHVFLGPDDFNGYGCFYATSTGSVSASTRTSSRSTSCLRLYCTSWWR